ncbi:MAG: hypothetical protein SWQ30_15805 [Thermodesulfobacteriota bacterium]|nr:hypothetical protein [Thermodesulfobacteriota bacterium]
MKSRNPKKLYSHLSRLVPAILFLLIVFFGCGDSSDTTVDIRYSEMELLDCPFSDYQHLESGVFFSADDVEAALDHEGCRTELTQIVDFEKNTLVYLTATVAAGCGDSGIELLYLTYDADVKKLYAHLHRWNFQLCEAALIFQKWLLIDKVSDDTTLEVVVADEG